jgi:hypothetical protein
MPKVIATHKVKDVDQWLTSTERDTLFGPIGVSFTTFVDPEQSNLVGLLLDVPDMEIFKSVMQSDAGSEAAERDGVLMDTLTLLVSS